MGDFSVNCIASGLGIYNADVRVLFLTQTSHRDENIVSVTDLWYPRTLPFKARYNGYGGFDLPKNPSKYDFEVHKVILDLFRRDVYEISVGENWYHKSEVRLEGDFTLEDLNDWARQGRLRVQGYNPLTYLREGAPPDPTLEEGLSGYKVPDFIPTVKNIRRYIPPEMVGSVFISKMRLHNFYSLKLPVGGDDKILVQVEKALKPHFSTMMTVSRLGLLLVVSPSVNKTTKKAMEAYSTGSKVRASERGSPALVRVGYIREDVWQELFVAQQKRAETLTKFFSEIWQPSLFEWVRKEAQITDPQERQSARRDFFWEKEQKYGRDGSLLGDLGYLYFNPLGSFAGKYLGGTQPRNHGVRFSRDWYANFGAPLPSEGLSEALTGLHLVERHLQSSRKVYQPSHSMGDQCTNPEEELRCLNLNRKVVSKLVKAKKSESM